MRLKGKSLNAPNVEFIVIPRTSTSGQSEDIVLKAQAILSFEDFDKMCPLPEPPMKQLPGGEYQIMEDHPGYKDKMNKYGERRLQYMVLKSLQATEDLEWETVDIGNPETWDNIDKELTSAGFSVYEIGRIRLGVIQANSLSEERMEEAKKRFLASLQVLESGK